MPKLDNPKHEAFALNLAKGMKQGEAYIRAGYQGNPSAASRMAGMPLILDRVAALEREIMGKMNDALTNPSEEAAQSLRELGLDMNWVATAYKKIYTSALDAESYAAANTAVANIQKLIEIERNGGNVEKEEEEPLVKLSDVSGFLSEARKLIELGQKQGNHKDMVDITPEDDATLAQVQAARAMTNDDDHER